MPHAEHSSSSGSAGAQRTRAGGGGGGGVWSLARTAVELQRRKPAFERELARRQSAAGGPAWAREEILCDAITAVVIDGQPIKGEQHLHGAFWAAVDFRIRRYHKGGTSPAWAPAAAFPSTSTTSPRPRAICPAAARARRARTGRRGLTRRPRPLERQVIASMGAHDIGPQTTARLLGLPLGQVRAAARSAHIKLDHVRTIARAGRAPTGKPPFWRIWSGRASANGFRL
jgi:hypothetical protein